MTGVQMFTPRDLADLLLELWTHDDGDEIPASVARGWIVLERTPEIHDAADALLDDEYRYRLTVAKLNATAQALQRAPS